jgi:hypothetical protein
MNRFITARLLASAAVLAAAAIAVAPAFAALPQPSANSVWAVTEHPPVAALASYTDS